MYTHSYYKASASRPRKSAAKKKAPKKKAVKTYTKTGRKDAKGRMVYKSKTSGKAFVFKINKTTHKRYKAIPSKPKKKTTARKARK